MFWDLWSPHIFFTDPTYLVPSDTSFLVPCIFKSLYLARSMYDGHCFNHIKFVLLVVLYMILQWVKSTFGTI